MGNQCNLLGEPKGGGVLEKPSSQQGMSLIELMTGVVILAILMAAATPSFTAWVQNSKIRTAAESVQNGLQLARVEAVRRNESVFFVLDAGSGWVIRSVATPNPPIQSRSGAEGGASVTILTTPVAATSVTFNGLGRIIANADGSASLTNIEVAVPTSVLPVSQMRKLQVSVSSGGQVRSCDPFFTLPDPRAC